MTRLLLSALLVSAVAVNGAAFAQWKRPAPRIEGCATPKQVIAAEIHNRGHEFKDARTFQGEEALFLSRWVGMAFPGVEPVVVVSYSNGDAAIISFTGAPECWRLEILERRK